MSGAGVVMTSESARPRLGTSGMLPFGTTWLTESTRNPLHRPVLSKSFGWVAEPSARFPVGPGYRSPASPRLEQPATGAPVHRLFGFQSRLPNPSAWSSSRPWIAPALTRLSNVIPCCAIWVEPTRHTSNPPPQGAGGLDVWYHPGHPMRSIPLSHSPPLRLSPTEYPPA